MTQLFSRLGDTDAARFRGFWIARAVSTAGSAASFVALPILVFEETHSTVLVALVAAANTLPYVFFGLLAGALADRSNRRTVMVGAELLSGTAVSIIAVSALLDLGNGTLIVALAFASATFSLFFESATYGYVPSLVGRDHLAAANARLATSNNLMRIIGAGSASLLISIGGTAFAITLDAATFWISAGILLCVVKSATPAEAVAGGSRTLQFVIEGLRALWNNHRVRSITVVGTLLSISGGAIIGQMVVFAADALKLQPTDWRTGACYSAWTAGGVLGSLSFKIVSKHLNPLRTVLWLLPLIAILSIAFMFVESWLLAAGLILVWGTGYSLLLVNTQTFAQLETPQQLQGRVNTTRRMLSSGLGVPLGGLLSSSTTAAFGIRFGVATAAGSLLLAVVAAFAFILPAMVRSDD